MTDELRAALLDWYAAKQKLRRLLCRTGKPGPALRAAERVDEAEARLEALAASLDGEETAGKRGQSRPR